MSELPYRVTDLEAVPEAARGLYRERDGAYLLQVSGMVPEDEVAGLKTALERTKEERSRIKQLNDRDLKELEDLREVRKRAEEDKAKQEGRWDDLRAKLQQEHEAERSRLNMAVESLTVTNELQRAIREYGVAPEYEEAVEALMLRKGPTVDWRDDKPVGVFRDEVHGNKPIAEAVKEWSSSDAAKAYLAPKTGAGGGGGGGQPRGGGTTKKYSDMNWEEKAAYLESQYADRA